MPWSQIYQTPSSGQQWVPVEGTTANSGWAWGASITGGGGVEYYHRILDAKEEIKVLESIAEASRMYLNQLDGWKGTPFNEPQKDDEVADGWNSP